MGISFLMYTCCFSDAAWFKTRAGCKIIQLVSNHFYNKVHNMVAERDNKFINTKMWQFIRLIFFV